jgi:hypothetical protein
MFMPTTPAVVERLAATAPAEVAIPQPVLAEIAFRIERLPRSKRRTSLQARFDLVSQPQVLSYDTLVGLTSIVTASSPSVGGGACLRRNVTTSATQPVHVGSMSAMGTNSITNVGSSSG